jgi:hypothetical protein
MERLLYLMTFFSALFAVMVLASLRRAHIRVEYSVSWLVASVILLILSRSPGMLEWLGRLAGVPDPALALVMIVAVVFLMVFFRFTLIVSHLKDSNIALAQRVAILEFRLHSIHEEKEAGKRS